MIHYIQQDNKAGMLKNKIRYYECHQLFKRMEDIPYAIVKGEALSLAAYSKTGERNSSDIDILISKKYISLLESLLVECGFEMSLPISREDRIFYLTQSHQIMPYVKRTTILNVVIDINFNIFWGENKNNTIDIDQFLNDTIETTIYSCKVKILPPIKIFIHLCLHHYKELNSIYLLSVHNYHRGRCFKDIHDLIKNNECFMDIQYVFNMCQDLSADAYIFYILYYTEKIFNDPFIKKYVEAFRTEKGELLLEHYNLDESNRKKWRISFFDRMNIESLYPYMEEDLNEDDKKSIATNMQYFV